MLSLDAQIKHEKDNDDFPLEWNFSKESYFLAQHVKKQRNRTAGFDFPDVQSSLFELCATVDDGVIFRIVVFFSFNVLHNVTNLI